jgi:hypothetical protein
MSIENRKVRNRHQKNDHQRPMISERKTFENIIFNMPQIYIMDSTAVRFFLFLRKLDLTWWSTSNFAGVKAPIHNNQTSLEWRNLGITAKCAYKFSVCHEWLSCAIIGPLIVYATKQSCSPEGSVCIDAGCRTHRTEPDQAPQWRCRSPRLVI